jgi:hypothetical protein
MIFFKYQIPTNAGVKKSWNIYNFETENTNS